MNNIVSAFVHKIALGGIVLIGLAPTYVMAVETNAVLSKSPATTNKPACGDNPSLGRVLLYKTGKGLQNVGDAIQRSSENTANAIKQRLNPEQQAQSTSSNAESVANNTTPQTLTESTAQQTSQQAGPAQAKTMIQGRLSQSTTSATAASELNQTEPASNGVKTYAIGTE